MCLPIQRTNRPPYRFESYTLYTESLVRPRSRRRRITARPPRVDIRLRKPSFRFLGRRFGCHVRFTVIHLSTQDYN